MSLAQAREQLPAIVHDVALHGPIELTEEGEPLAVIVSLDEYRKLGAEKPDTWTAYKQWRAGLGAEDLDIDSFLEGLRDPSPGREIEL